MKIADKIKMLTDPRCFEENRLAAVSDHRWYETEEEAIRGGEMKLRCSLNGQWKFHWAANPNSAPEGFEKADYCCEGWQTIPVPGHMELNGFGKPHYTNTTYPWDGMEDVKPHEVPLKSNPTGCYVRYFSLPEHFEGKRLQLHFEGVETAFHCWLNGKYIGYSEDSFTPAVFDVTDAAVQGENKLAVEVYRFATGSWLEDQDFWRMGGIMRDVALTALPKVHIRDLDAAVDVEDDYTKGVADVRLKIDTGLSERSGNLENGGVCGAPGGDRLHLVWKLLDAQIRGRETEEEVVLCGQEEITIGDRGSSTVFRIEVDHAKLWSAELPYLYRLVIEVQDARGNCIEAVPQQIGFCKV